MFSIAKIFEFQKKSGKSGNLTIEAKKKMKNHKFRQFKKEILENLKLVSISTCEIFKV